WDELASAPSTVDEASRFNGLTDKALSSYRLAGDTTLDDSIAAQVRSDFADLRSGTAAARLKTRLLREASLALAPTPPGSVAAPGDQDVPYRGASPYFGQVYFYVQRNSAWAKEQDAWRLEKTAPEEAAKDYGDAIALWGRFEADAGPALAQEDLRWILDQNVGELAGYFADLAQKQGWSSRFAKYDRMTRDRYGAAIDGFIAYVPYGPDDGDTAVRRYADYLRRHGDATAAKAVEDRLKAAKAKAAGG
ncbi:MAG: hypothetical protein KGI57_09950, partial [Hyphomicrobiales bacterium]|nr:hypothetical protein [Hyphomicrobiales bacterium]